MLWTPLIVIASLVLVSEVAVALLRSRPSRSVPAPASSPSPLAAAVPLPAGQTEPVRGVTSPQREERYATQEQIDAQYGHWDRWAQS